jgi:hypothetical protein
MDDPQLFSHPDAPQYIASDETSGDPVEYPIFSHRPDAQTAVLATRRS